MASKRRFPQNGSPDSNGSSEPDHEDQSPGSLAEGDGEMSLAGLGLGDSVAVATKPKRVRPKKAQVKPAKIKPVAKPKPSPKAKTTPTAKKAASVSTDLHLGEEMDVDIRRHKAYKAAQLFKMISEQSRVAIVLMLSESGSMNVTAMCEGLGQGQPATSHHLALLRHSGLIAPTRSGKNNNYSLTSQGEILARLIKKLIGEV